MGTPTNVNFNVAGKFGNAGEFNGSSSNISLPTSIKPADSIMSISLWASNNSTVRKSIFYLEYNNAPAFLALENNLYTDSTALGVYYNNAIAITAPNETLPPDGSWHHLVVTASATEVKLYKNGSQIGSTASVTVNTSALTEAHIGVRHYNNDLYWDGKIDQVRIFNRAITLNEVETLYDEVACPCTTNTIDYPTTNVAYYEFDGNADDSTTNGYNGTDTNVTWVQGRFGTAGSFNGSSSKIDTNISTITSNSGSVSLWVKTTTGTQSTFFGGQSPSQNRFYFGVRNNNFWMGAGDSQNPYTISASSLLDGDWHHVVLTLDGSTAKYYLDGNSTPVDTLSYTPAGTIGVTPLIGALDATGTVLAYTNGSIDQVRIFDTALTSDQVTDLYDEQYCFDNFFNDDSTLATYKLNGYLGDDSGKSVPLQSASSTYGSGVFDQALYLTGGQTASQTSTSYGSMNITGSYTVSFWFKATTGGKRNLIWYVDNIGYNGQIEFGSDNRLYFGGATITSQTYSVNTWYHIVMSFNISNGFIQAYVDGQNIGSRTLPSSSGSTQCFGHGAVGLTGYIDQVRIFDRILDSGEVTQLYNE